MITAAALKVTLIVGGAALALSTTTAAFYAFKYHGALTTIEQGKTEISNLRNEYAQAAIDATQQIRGLEAQLAAQAQENQDALLKERQAVRTAAAGFAAERQRVRDTIAKFAAGSGLAPDVAAATCSDRAARLGRGLDETLRAEESLVEQLEDQRADTRTLLRDARTIRSLISTERASATGQR